MDLAVLGADQDRSLSAESEVGVFDDRSREHGRDAGVDGIAALIIHPHAGLGRRIAPRCDRSARAANRMPGGRIVIFPLPESRGGKQYDRRESAEGSQCILHYVSGRQAAD